MCGKANEPGTDDQPKWYEVGEAIKAEVERTVETVVASAVEDDEAGETREDAGNTDRHVDDTAVG